MMIWAPPPIVSVAEPSAVRAASPMKYRVPSTATFHAAPSA